MLAVGLSDLSLRLLSSFTGKIVHVLTPTVKNPESSSLSSLSWISHFTSPSVTATLLDTANQASLGKFVLEDLLSVTSQAADLAKFAKTDLPRTLSAIDVETSLLKLSTLPATGGDDDVFSSRSSLDAIFHTRLQTTASALPNERVDVLSTYTDNGLLNLKIYDCFEIGNVSILPVVDPISSPGRSRSPRSATIVSHASHALSPRDLLVLQTRESSSDEKTRWFLVSLTLQFLPNTTPHLSLVAQKCTQLTNVLRYLRQTHRQLELEWRTAQDLPKRFIRNIEEDLASQEGSNAMDFKTVVFHTVMTGICLPVMREWLLDQVGDRGIKRWEKAMSTGYETLRRHVHECLLPAIERAEVIISRLYGLASYTPAAQTLGLDVRRIEQVRDALDCLTLLGEKLLLRVGKELRAFEKFIRWLKLEVEILSAEEGGQTWEELCEGREGVDVAGVLVFISGSIGERNVTDFIDEQKRPDGPSSWSPPDQRAAFYGKYKEMLNQGAESQNLPKLNDLLSYLASLCNQVFGHIGETLRKNVLVGRHLDVTDALGGTRSIDLRMHAEEDNSFSAYVASAQSVGNHDDKTKPNELKVIQAHMQGGDEIEIGETARFSISGISDVRFVDDEALFVLSSTAESSRMMEIRYREKDPQPHLRHDFGKQDLQRQPKRMDVNGRKGRRAVAVLDQNRTRYTVLDIDNGPPDEFDEAQDGETEGMEQVDDIEMVE